MVNELLKTYREELDTYYKLYEENMTRAAFPPPHIAEPSAKNMATILKAEAGALGARIGKASQRAKRGLVFDELLKAKKAGADLTFHKVQFIGAATAGSRFVNKLIIENFSRSGRTASADDRSTMTEEETQALIDEIAPLVERLNEALGELRDQANERQRASPSYQKLQQKIAFLLSRYD